MLCSAVAGRRVLRFEYDGRERVVEPYGHGWTTTGVEIVSGYQISGESVGGQVPGWKMFHVAKMTVRDDGGVTFAEPRPDYDPAKLRIGALCCRIELAVSDAPVTVRGQELPQRLTGVARGQV
jgi:hypothetical protein